MQKGVQKAERVARMAGATDGRSRRSTCRSSFVETLARAIHTRLGRSGSSADHCCATAVVAAGAMLHQSRSTATGAAASAGSLAAAKSCLVHETPYHVALTVVQLAASGASAKAAGPMPFRLAQL